MDSVTIVRLITEYGMIAVFLAIMLEYACFPVPSEIVLPFAGAYASLCGVAFGAILAVSVAAGLCGSLICYLIGYYGGTPILEKLKKRFGGMVRGIEASENWFKKYGGVSVAAGRVLPLCRTYISFVAGLSRQKPAAFFTWSAIGITVWNFVLVGLGYKLAGNWEQIALYAKRYTAVLIPVVILIIFFVICRIKKNANTLRQDRRS